MKRALAGLAAVGLALTLTGPASAAPGCVYSGGGWLCGGATPPGHDDPARIGGMDRFEAAANISAAFWEHGEASTVYIANAATPDALTGGASVDGPILLVGYGEQVPVVTLAEIARLAPVDVVALGGSASVSDAQLAAAAAAGRASTPAPAPPEPAPDPEPVPDPEPEPAPDPGPVAGADALGYAVPFWVLNEADDARLAHLLGLVADGGATWVRFDFAATDTAWTDEGPDWTAFDRVVAAADAQGLDILGVLHTLPPSVQTHGWNTGPATQAQRAAFVDFAQAAAQRYGPVVDAWELWNEPNLDQFWSPAPDVGDYAALLEEAYPVVKAADPASPVIAGGTGGAGGAPDIDSDVWYEQLYATGGGEHFDAATVHPYQDHGWARTGDFFTGQEMGRVPAVRSTMDAHGDEGKPIWGTEVGLPTSGEWSVTEAEQAAWVAPTYDGWTKQNTERGRIGPLFWYTLLDYDASREGSFGVFRPDGSAKPAYDALRQWAADQ